MRITDWPATTCSLTHPRQTNGHTSALQAPLSLVWKMLWINLEIVVQDVLNFYIPFDWWRWLNNSFIHYLIHSYWQELDTCHQEASHFRLVLRIAFWTVLAIDAQLQIKKYQCRKNVVAKNNIGWKTRLKSHQKLCLRFSRKQQDIAWHEALNKLMCDRLLLVHQSFWTKHSLGNTLTFRLWYLQFLQIIAIASTTSQKNVVVNQLPASAIGAGPLNSVRKGQMAQAHASWYPDSFWLLW